MNAVTSPGVSQRDTVYLFLATVCVFLLGFGAWLVVPMGLLKLGLIGVAGVAAGLLIFSHPKYGLFFGIYFVYAGLSYYTSFPVPAPVIFLVATAVILGLLRGDMLQLKDPMFNWAMALFTVFVLQSFLFAYDLKYAFSGLDFYFKSLLLVLLVVQLIRTPRDLERLAIVVFAGTFSTVILGVVNVKLGIVRDWTVLVGAIGWLRFGSTHINPNTAALYLVAGLPLGIYLIKRVKPIAFKILLVGAVISMIVATIMTFSRQAIFPLAFVLLATLFKEARSRRAYSVALAVVFTGVLFTPQYYWYRITSISQVFSTMNMDWSLAMRFKATKVGWQLFLDHPFTGIGLNNFIVRSASELIVRMGAHNTYIEILTGVGIFGFIAYIMMPVAGIRGFLRGIRAPWSPENRWMSDLSYYFLLSLIAVLMGAFFQMVQFYRLFWVPVICGVIAGRMAVEARLAARDQSV